MQRSVVKEIEEYGGWAYYDFQFQPDEYRYEDFDAKATSPIPAFLLNKVGLDFFHPIVQVNLNYNEDGGSGRQNPNMSADILEHVGKLSELRTLLLADTQVTDDTIHHLSRLKKMDRLYMWSASKVSDAGVKHLEPLKKMRYLHLSESKITDESMKVFATWPNIEGLSLQKNTFTNEALRNIGNATTLRQISLGLGRISIDNEGLVHVKNLPNLEHLGIQRSRVTPEGLAKLKSDRPKLKITK